MVSTFLGCSIGLIASNYIYQALAQQDWAVATERSVFQAVALVAIGICLALRSVNT